MDGFGGLDLGGGEVGEVGMGERGVLYCKVAVNDELSELDIIARKGMEEGM